MTQKYLKTVIWTSVVIMIYQGISNSNLAIISQFTHQNGNNWAGPLCTALLFLGSGIGCLYNSYIGKYKFKYCFYVGSYGYIIFISLGLLFIKVGFNLTTEILIFFFSFIAGLLCSVYYNTQFNYINALSKIDNKQAQYFGINMAFAQCSSVFSNILSSILIKPLGQFLTVLILDIIIILDSLIFLFFTQPDIQYNILFNKQQKTVSQKQQQKNLQQSIISEKNKQAEKRSKKPPIYVFMSFVFSGIIISFIYCLMAIIIYQAFQDKMDQTQLNFLTFILFIFEGIGEFVGGLLAIYLARKNYNSDNILVYVNSLFVLSVAIIYLGYMIQNQYIIGFGVFLSGVCDCSSFVSCLSIAGNWQQSGITSFNLGQTITVSITVMFMIFVPVFVSILWILLFYIFSMTGLYFYKRKKLEKQILY